MAGISFITQIKRLEHFVNTHYLEVPEAVIQQLSKKLKTKLICTVNQSLTFQCGLVALGEGRAYITLSGKRMKQLGVSYGHEVAVLLEEDESTYGMEVPEELAELLAQDDEGKKRFHGLPMGKQRYIIFYISSVKSSQLRIDRAVQLIGNLKRLPVGKESFRDILGIEK
jgi:hypothetical protein